MKCKHENAEHLVSVRDVEQTLERLVCLDCGHSLPLGPSNDEPEAVRDEIRLADGLAQIYCGSIIDVITRRRFSVCHLERDEACDAYIEGWSEAEPPPNPNLRPAGRPLSPIEMMVDRACGVTR